MRAQFDLRIKKKTIKKQKEIEELNKLRLSAGLSPLRHSEMPCMKCCRFFISEGFHNRLCWTCATALDKEGF